MILIEANNRHTTSNFELLEKVEKWAKANVQDDYCIVLNPHIEGDLKLTKHDPRESNNAPQQTITLDNETVTNTIARRS